MKYKLSRYHVTTPPIFDATEGRYVCVAFSTRTATARVLDAASWADLQAERFDELPTHLIDDLIADELIVQDAEDELTTVLSSNVAAIESDDIHYIVIQPTAMCQLGAATIVANPTAQNSYRMRTRIDWWSALRPRSRRAPTCARCL